MWRQEQILMESEYYIAPQLLMNANGAPCLLEEKKKLCSPQVAKSAACAASIVDMFPSKRALLNYS